jgi:hypothetical protein
VHTKIYAKMVCTMKFTVKQRYIFSTGVPDHVNLTCRVQSKQRYGSFSIRNTPL